MGVKVEAFNYKPRGQFGSIVASGTGTIGMRAADQTEMNATIRYESIQTGLNTQIVMVANVTSAALGQLAMSVIIDTATQKLEFRIGGNIVSPEKFNSIFGNMGNGSSSQSTSSN